MDPSRAPRPTQQSHPRDSTAPPSRPAAPHAELSVARTLARRRSAYRSSIAIRPDAAKILRPSKAPPPRCWWMQRPNRTLRTRRLAIKALAEADSLVCWPHRRTCSWRRRSARTAQYCCNHDNDSRRRRSCCACRQRATAATDAAVLRCSGDGDGGDQDAATILTACLANRRR